MKKTILSSLMGLSIIFTFAQNRSIQFEHGTWQEILSKAKAVNKPVFVDCYTSWCGPCKSMASDVFTKDTVADYYNSTFVCVKMDMEKGEGPTLMKQYKIMGFPTFLFVNAEGNLIHRSIGSCTPKEFINLGKSVFTDDVIGYWYDKYNSGNRDPQFMLAYIGKLKNAGEDISTTVKDYFSTQSVNNLSNNTNWLLMYNYLTEKSSREFRYVLANRKELSKIHGTDSVNYIIENVYQYALYNTIKEDKGGEKKYLQLKNQLKRLGTKNVSKILMYFDKDRCLRKKDWNAFLDLTKNYVEKFKDDDEIKSNGDFIINQTCWKVFEGCKDKNTLKKALLLAEKIKDSYFMCVDTYANLLYVNGKKKESAEYEQKSIDKVNDLLKQMPDNLELIQVKKDYENNLEKFKK